MNQSPAVRDDQAQDREEEPPEMQSGEGTSNTMPTVFNIPEFVKMLHKPENSKFLQIIMYPVDHKIAPMHTELNAGNNEK